MNEELRQKIAAKRAEMEKQEQAATPPASLPTVTADFSRFMDAAPELDSADLALEERKRFIEDINVVDVYTKLTGKSPRRAQGQTESIMGFCVSPHHDNTESEAMWMNSKKNTWKCAGVCETGGGVVGLVGLSIGLNPGRGMLRGKEYAKAEEALLIMYGWEFTQKSTGEWEAKTPTQVLLEKKAAQENREDVLAQLKKPEPQVAEAPVAATPPPGDEGNAEHLAEVISITSTTDDLPLSVKLPTFDWRKVCTPNTAISEYMDACIVNAVPEQFHFFNAMMLVGLAAGRRVAGPKKDVFYGNISPILIGNSGVGKSMSWKPVRTVLKDAMPFFCLPSGEHAGVVLASAPGSGEDLMDVFNKNIDKDGKPIENLRGVKALISYGEVSHFVSKATAKFSVLENSIQDLYDAQYDVGVRSRSGGQSNAVEPFFCLTSTSQPRIVGQTFTANQVANGLAGRLDFVTGTYKDPDPFDNETNSLDKAIAEYKVLSHWANQGERNLEWSAESRPMWADFFNKKIRPIKRDEETDINKRIDLKVKKFALIFAINEMHEEIMPSDLQKAIYLFEYVSQVLSFIGGKIGKTQRTETEEEIFEFILEYFKANGKPCCMRDIKRRFQSRKWENGEYLQAIKGLSDMEEIIIESIKPKRGPAKDMYTPAVEALK